MEKDFETWLRQLQFRKEAEHLYILRYYDIGVKWELYFPPNRPNICVMRQEDPEDNPEVVWKHFTTKGLENFLITFEGED